MCGLRLDCRHGNLDLRHTIWLWLWLSSTRWAVFTGAYQVSMRLDLDLVYTQVLASSLGRLAVIGRTHNVGTKVTLARACHSCCKRNSNKSTDRAKPAFDIVFIMCRHRIALLIIVGNWINQYSRCDQS